MGNSSENFKAGKYNKEIMKHRGPYKIDEASLNRAYQHVVEKKVPSWGMMTAYRYANTPKENEQKNKELEKDLRSLGYGFFKVEGHWQECQDSTLNYVDCPKDKLQDSIEESLFVPGITKEHSAKLCKKYEQDAVIYGGKDTDGDAHLLFKNGGEENIGEFQPGKVAQAYSKLKGGKSFVFQARKDEPKKDEPLKFEPKAPEKKGDMKLKSMLPKSVLDKMVKNPETGKTIKVKSALQYDKQAPVFQLAKKIVTKAK
jgi:hypothetical protein